METSRRNHRPLVMGLHGAVGANHPLAAQAGLDVLRAGGNAADAAVAVSLTLGVVEPAMSGLGGDGFFHFYCAKTHQSKVFNGSGPAPLKATVDLFPGGFHGGGPLSVSVPGKLGALGLLHSEFGSLAWSTLVRPAIDIAREGFGATHSFCTFVEDARARLIADPRSAASYLGKTPGDVIGSADLARTLEEIASDGAETFYRGALAKRLARAFRECGTLITEQDLAEYRAETADPLCAGYRGMEIRQTPPNSTGFTMLQILKILENFDYSGMSEADRIHVAVEAKKLAFVDRDRYSTDPRLTTVPVDLLLSDEYTRDQAARIRFDQAADLPIGRERLNSDTTYFCVVDDAGNALSGIQSNASTFGSGVKAGDTGILLNNRLSWFELDPRLANCLAPAKRISHTMNAPLVFKNNRLWCVLGTPGADYQVQVNVQVLTSLVDLDLDPQSAVERPRWTSSQAGQGATWRNDGHGRLSIEEDVGKDTLASLHNRGHRLDALPHLHGPCAMQVIRMLPNGLRMAGSDPRRDGWAAAY